MEINIIQQLENARRARAENIVKPKSREVSDWEQKIQRNTPSPAPAGQPTLSEKIDEVTRLQQIYGGSNSSSEASGDGSIPLNGAQVLRKAIGALEAPKKSTAQILGEALRGGFKND
ncbi:hypothetical protein L5G28_16385 [Gordonia sp. HY285]|uniref:hypothetical protein n=1 Tax=Gordonia liuliyuniae TaxID=2911517 RepID=UPI001F1CD4DC|nr:hypothetical protein [Gordonia liuliyuniae]MCF8611725.1 hypothetical protein [Gordonia liuliyuniae]